VRKVQFFKSLTGLLFSGVYLVVVGLVLISDLMQEPDAFLRGLVTLLGLPWIVVVVELDRSYNIADSTNIRILLIASCILLNSIIFYALGFMVSKALEPTE
jgi:hypothetical protein